MLAGELGNSRGVEVHAIADTREVVQHYGDSALGGDLTEEVVDDGRGSGLAEVRRGQNQGVVGACISSVGNKLEDLARGVATDAGHDGEVGPGGFAGDLHQLLALLARQQEGLGIGAQDDEASEAGLGEI